MPHRARLHLDELAQIWNENSSPVVLQLLWEIHRLQSTIRRAQQVREMIRTPPVAVPAIVWQAFEQELDGEPCLTDNPTERQKKKINRWAERLQAEREHEERKKPRTEVDPSLGPLTAFFASDRS
ncbi:hypothetical protein [Pararobbsia alpina]|uniref:Uncharacterized protein n=1 Tax=Pararobbsia alpina TaxID=621374 RepID=A0A6S7C0M1_9BURK|nr:hypothetical protein [Pararobbsia alpina]CAB3805420.1 hypothetical protein LMG28138_05662 [Pararobbsia alpina]